MTDIDFNHNFQDFFTNSQVFRGILDTLNNTFDYKLVKSSHPIDAPLMTQIVLETIILQESRDEFNRTQWISTPLSSMLTDKNSQAIFTIQKQEKKFDDVGDFFKKMVLEELTYYYVGKYNFSSLMDEVDAWKKYLNSSQLVELLDENLAEKPPRNKRKI